ncbi:MAG: ABC transporter substrate-binding protein [Bdellovibrionales bacterium]|nr:ABC transporter substrate-binding protein [Bdellovibrionales bacterium]
MRRILGFSFIAVMALVSATYAAAPASGTDKVKLALNWKPEPQFGGFYAARFFDLDKKNGVEFEIVAGGAGTPVVQMIAAGQFDFGIASGDEIVVSRVRGIDLVALFATYQTNPQGVMTHAERGFESLADVFKSPGTIAMQKGLPYALYLQNRYSSGRRASVVPYLGGVANFLGRKDHSQQCFVTSEPLLALKQGAKVKTFLVADSGFNPYTTVLVTRRSLLAEKPELVKNVVAAVRAGWRQYLDQPDATNEKMSGLNPSIDPATMKEMAAAQKPLIEPLAASKDDLGKMQPGRWTELEDQLRKMKVIDKKSPPGPYFVEL